MKKIIAFTLIILLCFSVLSGCGADSVSSSDDMDTSNTEHKPKLMEPVSIPDDGVTINGEYFSKEALALRAVADAYVNRGEWIQYDDSRLVAGSAAPSPIYRWSHGNNGVQDPENATEKHTLYTNCAAFIHTLYKETFDFDLGSWTTAQFIERDDMIVFKYNVTGMEDSFERQRICNNVWEMLKPGDLIVYRYGDEKNGHIMAYIGQDTLVHSTAPGGGSFDYSTPAEKAETNGSIQYMDVTQLFRESYSRYLFKLGRFAVLRPLDAFKDEIRITEETLNRMQYLSGVTAQLFSTHPYGVSADMQSEQITYTVRIDNANNLAVECVLEAAFDQNAEYVSGADRFDGQCAYWQKVVPALSSTEITYTVKPKSGLGSAALISCGVVKLNGVQLLCPDIAVKNTLDTQQRQQINKAAMAYVGKKTEPANIINSIYTDATGVSPNFGSEKEIFQGVFEFFNGTTTHLVIDSDAKYYDLVVDAVYGGRYVVNSDSLSKRTSVVRTAMLITGDVLIASSDVDGQKCSTYLMLENNKLMELDHSGGVRILTAQESEDLLMKILAKRAFALLRPSFGM